MNAARVGCESSKKVFEEQIQNWDVFVHVKRHEGAQPNESKGSRTKRREALAIMCLYLAWFR